MSNICNISSEYWVIYETIIFNSKYKNISERTIFTLIQLHYKMVIFLSVLVVLTCILVIILVLAIRKKYWKKPRTPTTPDELSDDSITVRSIARDSPRSRSIIITSPLPQIHGQRPSLVWSAANKVASRFRRYYRQIIIGNNLPLKCCRLSR